MNDYQGPNTAAYQQRLAELVEEIEAKLVAATGPGARFHVSLSPAVALKLASRFGAAAAVMVARAEKREVRQSDIETVVTTYRVALNREIEGFDREQSASRGI